MNALRTFIQTRRRMLAAGAVFLVVAGFLQFAGANPAQSQTITLTAYPSDADPAAPDSKAWKDALPIAVPLTAQAGTYAAGGGSIPTISARALHHKDQLYVRLEWTDATDDESTARVQDFSDAVAIEFPARAATSVPSICMGQADAGVNIWQWRADSQAGIPEVTTIHPNALVESYPSTEDLFFTARAAGNPVANPAIGAVQNLISRTFGTLSPAATQQVLGKGVYKDGKWSVVFSRPFAGPDVDQASFSSGTKTDIAFAVWNGSEGDRNGRKSVSAFVTLSISAQKLPGTGGGNDAMVLTIALLSLLGITALGVGLAVYGYREGRTS
ncbi:MAG: hypothetical protein HY875_16630 [Chloroflexi bacterium]|nr:hypothetical protein [Chloroflexota bacterium]